MICDIEYRGSQSGLTQLETNGDISQNTSLDLSEYREMLDGTARKSHYWATNLTGILPGWQVKFGLETSFNCSAADPNDTGIAVFIIDNDIPDQRKLLANASSYEMSNSCLQKTVLINVIGSSDVVVNAGDFYWVNSAGVRELGYENYPTCLISSTIWNFPNASNVEIGGEFVNQTAGLSPPGAEFRGSVLIPNGNLLFQTSGQSGRTIVGGDVIQNYCGSEFHSYDFSPPFNLPLPTTCSSCT